MNFVTNWLLYTGSGRISLLGTSLRRGIGLALLVTFRAVLAAALIALGDADGVERAADDVVTDARQILHAAAADQHDRVLLQVVADAGDVRRDFDAVRQTDARDLAQRRVRLLRRRCVDARANPTLLRARLQRR